VPTPRHLLAAAALLAACGSSRPADSTASNAEPRTEPADAGVSLGRPSEPGDDAGTPELPPRAVPYSLVEPQRTGGTRDIAPDEPEQAVMAKAGKHVVAVVKLCVAASGAVGRIQLIKSSGYPAYDDKILREMKSWTFGPIAIEGQPADVCTPVTFSYKPSAAPPP
jgi:TonB family protein